MTREIRTACSGKGLAASLGLVAMLAVSGASAQDADAFPEQPLRLIVPLAPGGSVDLVSRLVAEELGTILGQQVVVENRPGASGSIGVEEAKHAAADGYTLVMGSSSTFGTNPSLYDDLPYDPIVDFAPLSFISYAPNVLVVPASLGVATVQELVTMAQERPGELNFGSSGVGGSPHLAGELFKREAAVDIVHVPYKSSGESMTDLLGGRIDISFATVIATQEHIEAGTLVPLAVTTPERVPVLPDVPTMTEAGYPEVEISAWNGLLTPAGTPEAIVAKLSEAIQQAVHSAEVTERLKAEGAVPVGSTSEEFAQLIAREITKWGEIIEAAGIEPD